MKACDENASRTMFDSEPQSSKITQVAKKSFFEIAKQDAWVRCPRLETTRSSWPLYRALQIIVTVPFRSRSISCSVILARGCRAKNPGPSPRPPAEFGIPRARQTRARE
jgi:hypothetical protein